MKIVMQRVTRASVYLTAEDSENRREIACIGPGMVVLVGIGRNDDAKSLVKVANRLIALRVFPDESGKMNLDIQQYGGAILAVSQFTLLADVSRGRRPGFSDAAPPEIARPLFEGFVRQLETTGVAVATGKFGADMDVELCNDGPVTIIFDDEGES
jgi:D-tyrosyl-tRNA(Tyr) deacylase